MFLPTLFRAISSIKRKPLMVVAIQKSLFILARKEDDSVIRNYEKSLMIFSGVEKSRMISVIPKSIIPICDSVFGPEEKGEAAEEIGCAAEEIGCAAEEIGCAAEVNDYDNNWYVDPNTGKVYPKKNVHVVFRPYICIFCIRRYMKQNHVYKVCDLNPFPENLQCRFESVSDLARHIKKFHKEVNRNPKDLAKVKKCTCGNFMTSAANCHICFDEVKSVHFYCCQGKCRCSCAGQQIYIKCEDVYYSKKH